MESYSTREMIDYSHTRGEERVCGVKARSDFIEALIDIFDRTLESGYLFDHEVGCCKPVGSLVFSMGCV